MHPQQSRHGSPLWRIVLLACMLCSVWTTIALAQPRGPMGGDGERAGMGFLLHLLNKLNLTPEQQAQVQERMEAHRLTFQSLRADIQSAQDRLVDKLLTPGPTTAADMQPLHAQASQLRAQLAQEALHVMLEVRELLTPEQLTQAGQLKDRLRTLRSEMRQLMDERP